MATIKVKQTKSRIKCPKDQKRTLDALGLMKMNQVVEHEATPAILGMVEKVKHLVSRILTALNTKLSIFLHYRAWLKLSSSLRLASTN